MRVSNPGLFEYDPSRADDEDVKAMAVEIRQLRELKDAVLWWEQFTDDASYDRMMEAIAAERARGYESGVVGR
jgi:hypothetical protein